MLGGATQTSVRTRMRPAVPGRPVDVNHRNDAVLLINKDPQAVEIFTLVIDTATNDETYGVDLADPEASVSYLADGATSKIEIAAGIVAAWNASPLARGIAVATTDGVDTVTFTGLYPGQAFVLTEDENAAKMTLTNTQDAATADTVPFGRAMIVTGWETDEADQYGVIAKSTALAARVSTLTVTYAAGEIYTVGLTVSGTRYEVNVAADTNDDNTATAIRAAINGMMPANTVIASGATNEVILTAELAGQYFEVDLGLVSGTTARLVLADITNTPLCDFNAVFAGISQFTYDQEETTLPTSGTAEQVEYAAGAGVTAMTRGGIWVAVDSGTTVTNRSDVYVELDGTGSNAGRLYTSNSATRTLVDPKLLKWRRAAHSDSDADVAAVQVDLAA